MDKFPYIWNNLASLECKANNNSTNKATVLCDVYRDLNVKQNIAGLLFNYNRHSQQIEVTSVTEVACL